MTTEFRPLTKECVADVLGVCVRTIDNWVNDGTLIAPRKLGSRPYWHPRTFYAWLDQALSAPPAGENSDAPDTATGQHPPKAPPSTTKSKAAVSGKSESDAIRARDRAKLDVLLG